MNAADEGELMLSATRRLAAPVPRVWSACTTKRELERWWGPADLQTTVRRLEVRKGGAIAFHVRYVPALLTRASAEAFRAAGVPIAFDLRGTVTELVPESLLVFDLTLDLGKSGAGIPMATRLELVPDGDATQVTVSGSGQPTPHWRTLGAQNLAGQLERLERVVAPGRSVVPGPLSGRTA